MGLFSLQSFESSQGVTIAEVLRTIQISMIMMLQFLWFSCLTDLDWEKDLYVDLDKFSNGLR